MVREGVLVPVPLRGTNHCYLYLFILVFLLGWFWRWCCGVGAVIVFGGGGGASAKVAASIIVLIAAPRSHCIAALRKTVSVFPAAPRTHPMLLIAICTCDTADRARSETRATIHTYQCPLLSKFVLVHPWRSGTSDGRIIRYSTFANLPAKQKRTFANLPAKKKAHPIAYNANLDSTQRHALRTPLPPPPSSLLPPPPARTCEKTQSQLTMCRRRCEGPVRCSYTAPSRL